MNFEQKRENQALQKRL